MEISVIFYVPKIVRKTYAIYTVDFVNRATLDGEVQHVTQVCCFKVMHLYLMLHTFLKEYVIIV